MERTKILVVDDDPKIRKIIKHCMEKEGYEITTAENGEEAIKVIPVQQPDLIVLDLMLPKMSGLDVLTQLIEMEQNVPVVILSAKGEAVDRITGFRMGIDDYLAKPFSPVELALRIKAVLRRVYSGSSKGEDKAVKCGNLHIDARTHQVFIKEKEVALTGKEFELLLYFASNPGQVFTRQQLLNKVWQSDYEGDENTVTVHIRRLREKIEEDPSSPKYIQTVWGVGYKFEKLIALQ